MKKNTNFNYVKFLQIFLLFLSSAIYGFIYNYSFLVDPFSPKGLILAALAYICLFGVGIKIAKLNESEYIIKYEIMSKLKILSTIIFFCGILIAAKLEQFRIIIFTISGLIILLTAYIIQHPPQK